MKYRRLQPDYDLTRSDKFFKLTIPSYTIEAGVVFYEVALRDLVNNTIYITRFRFKEMKTIHESLQQKKFELPHFPKTHFWSKTNNNPQLIEKRRLELENYFSLVVNDPFLRGYRQVKEIIKSCKKNCGVRRRNSSPRSKGVSTRQTRSLSECTASASELRSKQEWKSLGKKNHV